MTRAEHVASWRARGLGRPEIRPYARAEQIRKARAAQRLRKAEARAWQVLLGLHRESRLRVEVGIGRTDEAIFEEGHLRRYVRERRPFDARVVAWPRTRGALYRYVRQSLQQPRTRVNLLATHTLRRVDWAERLLREALGKIA